MPQADRRRSDAPVQLLSPVDDDALEAALDHPDFVAMEKYDGQRRQALYAADGNLVGINRKREFVPLTASVKEAMRLLPRGTLLDGELVGDVLYVFDVLSYGGKDLSALGFGERIRAPFFDIAARLKAAGNSGIVPVPSTYGAKRQLLEQLRQQNAEGIVLRDGRAPATHGRPASGGAALKFKFVETCTCIVRCHNAQRSVGISLLDDDGRKVDVGNVTIAPSDALPGIGALVEFRYLYANPGGALQQPFYLGSRNDMDESDATFQQLKYKRDATAA